MIPVLAIYDLAESAAWPTPLLTNRESTRYVASLVGPVGVSWLCAATRARQPAPARLADERGMPPFSVAEQARIVGDWLGPRPASATPGFLSYSADGHR